MEEEADMFIRPNRDFPNKPRRMRDLTSEAKRLMESLGQRRAASAPGQPTRPPLVASTPPATAPVQLRRSARIASHTRRSEERAERLVARHAGGSVDGGGGGGGEEGNAVAVASTSRSGSGGGIEGGGPSFKEDGLDVGEFSGGGPSAGGTRGACSPSTTSSSSSTSPDSLTSTTQLHSGSSSPSSSSISSTSTLSLSRALAPEQEDSELAAANVFAKDRVSSSSCDSFFNTHRFCLEHAFDLPKPITDEVGYDEPGPSRIGLNIESANTTELQTTEKGETTSTGSPAVDLPEACSSKDLTTAVHDQPILSLGKRSKKRSGSDKEEKRLAKKRNRKSKRAKLITTPLGNYSKKKQK